jgi:lipoprotein-releasing system permease protein
MRNALAARIALRYLRGKRGNNAVPILSRISMVAIAVGSAALLVALSVFNGLELVVSDMYRAFYPEVKITAARGKFFAANALPLAAIQRIDGVAVLSMVLEDNALASDMDRFSGSANRQKVVVVKGVDNNYFSVSNIRDFVNKGEATLSIGGRSTAILGFRIANELGADIKNSFSTIVLYYPDPAITNPESDPVNAYRSLQLKPSATFLAGDEFDDKFILAPLNKVQELLHADGMLSSIEIKTTDGSQDELKTKLTALLGNKFKVETRYEQNATLYGMMKAEKWVMFLILIFVLIIASFNMTGALSMLIVEKQKDIAILRAMGAETADLKRIFLSEGMLWALIGGLCGIALGLAVYFAQLNFGLIKMGGAFMVDAYPVALYFTDVLMVLAAIITVGLMVSWYPARRAAMMAETGLKAN